VRRLVKWALVTLGIVAIVRRLRRRRAEAKPAPHTVGAADPADELRRKLAESRTADEAAEPPPPSAAPVEERRAEVHAEGRAAVDEMRSSDES
jgi:hypothetical protein